VIQGAGPVGYDAVRCVYVGENAVLSGFTLNNGATLHSSVNRDADGGGHGASFRRVEQLCGIGQLGLSRRWWDIWRYAVQLHAVGQLGRVRRWSICSTLYNCTLTGNSAYYGGGADYGALYNCTLTGNSAFLRRRWANNGTLNNCIVFYNTAADGPNLVRYYTALTYCCTTEAPPGQGNITKKPQFVNAAASDYRLLPSSPCIDKGIQPGLDVWRNRPGGIPYNEREGGHGGS